MPPIELRQTFPTLKAFKEALHAWAIEAHFEPRILKSDTGRVRVGCKRDPNCPFVIRCNWERKGGREPLARVTVLRDRHTCVNGSDWVTDPHALGGVPNGLVGGNGMGGAGGAPGPGGGMNMGVNGGLGSVDIRQDEAGNIVGGARVLGPVDGQAGNPGGPGMAAAPVLPKVQRNSASRLPFLMEILPRLMNITKETTPAEIRDVLLREYGAEVHLQQCRRAKTEILKKQTGESEGRGEPQHQQPSQSQPHHQQQQQHPGPSNMGQQQMESLNNDGGNDASQQLFGNMSNTPNASPHAFTLHNTTGVVAPPVNDRSSAALIDVGEPPVRCPYCINHRWMRSIKDAVEHMSMHVVV